MSNLTKNLINCVKKQIMDSQRKRTKLIFLNQFIIQSSIVIDEKRVLWAELNWVTGTTHHDFQELVLPKGTGCFRCKLFYPI